MTKEELLAMDKNQLAAQVIAASLPRDRKFDAMKDENYWHKDLIKFLQQKISTLERKCGTSEEQCQIEGGENKKTACEEFQRTREKSETKPILK